MERYNPKDIPRGVRQFYEPPADYSTVKKDVRFDLVQGESPFGPPAEYDLMFENPEKRKTLLDMGKHYIEVGDGLIEKPISNIENRFGLREGESEIFLSGSGSAGVLERLIQLIPPRPRVHKLYAVGPTFPYFHNYAQTRRETAHGEAVDLFIENISVNLGKTVEDTMEAAKEARSRRELRQMVMHYLCNPTSPQGEVISPDVLEDYIASATTQGDMVIVDEAYGDWLSDKESAIRLTQKYPNLAVTRTLSKLYALPGTRIGYSVMSKGLGELYEKTFEYNPYYMTGHQIAIANEIIDKDVMLRHAQEVRIKTQLVKKELMYQLRKLYGSRELIILPTDDENRTPTCVIGTDSPDFYNNLYAKGVAGAPGSGFSGTHDEYDDSLVRIMIPKSVTEIPSLIRRIREAAAA